WKGFNKEVVEYDLMYANLCDTLLSSHIDFDYGDEEILSKWAKVIREDGLPVLKVNKATYNTVLVPPLFTIRSSTLKILKQFKDAGGNVIFVEKIPDYVDAVKKEEICEYFEVADSIEQAINKIEGSARCVSIVDENGKEIKEILYLLREDKEAFYLFLCNTSMEWKPLGERHALSCERNIAFNNVIISGNPAWKNAPVEIDPNSGKFYSTETIEKDSTYAIKTSFPALGSRLYIIPKTTISIPVEKRQKLQEIEKIRIEKDKWDILLSEHNVLVLDRPQWKISDGTWQDENEILRIDREIRKYLGIPIRGKAMMQPWARKESQKTKSTNVCLKYRFFIETIPTGETCLAIEKPELYRISINGHQINSDLESGWWVDRSLRLLRFDPSILCVEENQIVLETIYNAQHPGFEIIYILGSFGVKMIDNNPAIVRNVQQLSTGDWTQQGLLFYSGNVTYLHQIQIEVKENQKIFVNIPDYRAAAVRILVDGKSTGIIAWPPNCVDITEFIKDGKPHTLGVEVLGHRRNSHGPFHFYQKYPQWTGPYQFVAEGEEFCHQYQLVPFGLMKEPEIIRYTVE
ncbi:MAG: hypothetical protein NC902_08570, partial [Candidatus Omnitrophica bacterium]|nr:hypothetical protein [Candidatus Omnitrophota bacterium]